MKPMIAMITYLLSERRKCDFPNNKVSITEAPFCAKIFWSMERTLFKRVRL